VELDQHVSMFRGGSVNHVLNLGGKEPEDRREDHLSGVVLSLALEPEHVIGKLLLVRFLTDDEV